MNLWLGLLMGLKEIWAHKFRSILTMLGIILGVASLMAMFALTAGMAAGMREHLEKTGGIERVGVTSKEPSQQLQNMAQLSPGRTMLDVEALRVGAPGIDLVTPEVHLGGATLTRGSKTARVHTVGTIPAYAELNKFEIGHGRMLSDLDVQRAQRVIVLGASVVEELWGSNEVNPVGQTVFLNDRPFRVIGSFPFFESEAEARRRALGIRAAQEQRRERRSGEQKARRWDPFHHKNNASIIPVTTMQQEFKSAQMTNNEDQGPDVRLSNLTFRVKDLTRFDEAIQQARNVLERTHRGIDDFGFDTREDWAEGVETGVRAARASGGIIAGISLLVGGIGITNIMLASITERIREIGIRRAVGARRKDIFVQIVVESAVIGFIGGLLGLATSAVVLRILMIISPTANEPLVEPASVLVSFGFAVIIGVVSGIYPALRASRLDPIEALRYG